MLPHAVTYGNVKITCGLKWVEDQEEQKEKEKQSKHQKLADKDQLPSLEYFAQSCPAGSCHA